MSRRRIGQEQFGFAVDRGQQSSLDDLTKLIDWTPVDHSLGVVSCSAKGEPAWPPLALFKAMLLSIWYDLSDVKLAEALDDRGSFRRFCGFSVSETTPERTAFVRFRKALVTYGLDKTLFDEITRQLKAKAIKVKTGNPSIGRQRGRHRPRRCGYWRWQPDGCSGQDRRAPGPGRRMVASSKRPIRRGEHARDGG